MRTVLLVFVALVCVRANAQDEEAVALTDAQMGFTLNGANDVLATTNPPFLRGWNWVNMDRLSSEALGVNFWHLNDPWTWQGTVGDMNATVAEFQNHHLPNQLLISSIDGISMNQGPGVFGSPFEAMAMEYQPWLELDATADPDTFILQPTDPSGGVFGFFTRSPLGTVVVDPADNCRRYRLETNAFTGPQTVLADVEHDEAMYRQDVANNPTFSAIRIRIAINLRRNDASSDVGQEDDVVLRIRVPYWYRDRCANRVLARFRNVPHATGPIEVVTSSLGRPMGSRWPLGPDINTAPTEFVITRRMIPQLNATEPDVTVRAEMVFDYADDDERITPPNDPWQNPRLNHDAVGLENHWVDRLGIEVVFEDELGVDIKWARLETIEAGRLFWGEKDADIQSHMHDFMENLIAFRNTSYAGNNNQPRLYRIYGRDEIRLSHFKGFRYVNRMLQNLVATEWGIREYNKARLCMGMSVNWQGFGFAPHEQIPSPTFRHGSEGNQVLLDDFCGYMFGRDDRPDFETRIYASIPQSCSTSTNPTWNGALPIPTSQVDHYLNRYSGGVLANLESILYKEYLPNQSVLFDPTVSWIANIWDYSSGVVGVAPAIRYRLSSNGRTKSPEEIRLKHWLPLILGAKGFAEYCGQTSGGTLPNTIDWQNFFPPGTDWQNMTITQDIGLQYQSDAAINAVTATGDARIDDNGLGTDYLQQGDPDNLHLYIRPFNPANPADPTWDGLQETAEDMNNNLPNPPGIYVGRRSMRQAVREVYRSLDPYWNTLSTLRLTGWNARGFTRWFAGNASAYDHWLRRDDASQRVRVCNEPEPDLPWLPRMEDPDSSFFDITLHRAADTSLAQVAYIGVLNRRSSGLTKTEVNGQFRTYQEYFDYINDPANGVFDSLYSQNGARRIRIPFHYDHPQPTAVNLRVEELRNVTPTLLNQRPRIDTIIGAESNLEVDFLPGEGKFFRVTPVPASTAGPNAGFLDNSNQRKLVAFPQVDHMEQATDPLTNRTWQRVVAGDLMWYHRVYHRRDENDPLHPLRVWYQRSIPYVTNEANATPATPYAFSASTITWEPEINVSSQVQLRGEIENLSCGYPALVTRVDNSTGNPIARVYIVFGCELPQLSSNPMHVLVCETILPAEVDHALQAASYNVGNPSVVLDEMVVPEPQQYLKHYGAPMINASATGNYYCWARRIGATNADDVIRVGFKPPQDRIFLNPLQIADVKHQGMPWGGMRATHPSLNSYSRLHLGEDDAGLVWQEGADVEAGNFILYTRLTHDATNAIGFGIPAVEAGPAFRSPFNINIGIVADAATYINEEYEFAYGAYPVLYRHLSDWEIGPTSSRFDLRLVNHKAERAYWHARVPGTPDDRWVIGRRVFDLSLKSQGVGGGIDEMWSQSDNYIFSDDVNLRYPDVSQGSQWGEWGSIPNYPSWEYDDSTCVVEFCEAVDETDPNPSIWSMTFGYDDFYGIDADHAHEDLVASGLARQLFEQGKYTHLAARHSYSGFPGWQRNRRIFATPGGNYIGMGAVGYTQPPPIVTSSQYFFKPVNKVEQREALKYHGFRSRSGFALITSPRVASSTQPVSMKLGLFERDKSLEMVSSWMTLQTIDDIELRTRTFAPNGDYATVFFERKSDGLRVELNALWTSNLGKSQRHNMTILADSGERYRLVLAPPHDAMFEACDIGIHDKQVKQHKKAGEVGRLIDLRSMTVRTQPSEQPVSVYPNPASGNVTILISAELAGRVSVYDELGRLWYSERCDSVDVLQLDATQWPSGVYSAVLRPENGTQFYEATTRFTVIR